MAEYYPVKYWLKTFTLTNKKNKFNKSDAIQCTVNAKAGDDVITVTRWVGSEINGGTGNDTITLKDEATSLNTVHAGSGNDVINIKKPIGAQNEIYGDAGNDKITFKGDEYSGNYNVLHGGAGNDTITVSAAPILLNIYGDAGNDKISVTNKIGKVTYTSDSTADPVIISGGAGNDTITVKGGCNHKIYSGTGTDTIKITNGSLHKIYLDSGKNKVNLTTSDVTLYTGKKSVDSITINWSKDRKNNGKCVIKTSKSLSEKSTYNDTLRIVGIKSSVFDFTYKNKTLVLSTNSQSKVMIENFLSSGFKAITFSDRTLSRAALDRKAKL